MLGWFLSWFFGRNFWSLGPFLEFFWNGHRLRLWLRLRLRLRWIKSVLNRLPNIFTYFTDRISNILNIMDNLFTEIFHRVCSINGNMLYGFGSILGSVLNGIGNVSDKPELRKDWGKEERCKNKEFHFD